MKTGLNSKNLICAFGGLAAVFMSAAASPAFAAPFTDVNGNTCDTSALVPGGPGGQSICPGGGSPTNTAPSSGNSGPLPIKVETPRGGSFVPFGSPSSPLDSLVGLPFGPTGPSNGSGNRSLGGGEFGSGVGLLGMHVDGPPSGDAILSGGGYSLHNSGVGISDSAGLLTPGATSSTYRDNGGGGGITGIYDASALVGSYQRLFFAAAFDYASARTNYGGASAGSSISSDNYRFTASALYAASNTYLRLNGSYQFGNNTEFTAADASSGSYGSDGYEIDARLGHVFFLYDSIVQPMPSKMALKAPPRPAEGYAIGLDLSGHLGYASNVARGFTDSAGFVFGDERAEGGETGLNAKLFADVPQGGVTWQPYVSGSVDWRFSYSHVANFPGQLALATGDAITFADATTFVGAKAGLNVKMINGWTVGADGFYEHSSDTEIVGGQAYVRIPFGPDTLSARY